MKSVLATKDNHIEYRNESSRSAIASIFELAKNVAPPEIVRDEHVVIMAGGFGKRMMPLTRSVPKPLLPIAGAPLIEHILAPLISQGFIRFTISVHHMAQCVRDWSSGYTRPELSIDIVEESSPLGTAGALSLLNLEPNSTLVVANADIITDLDYRKALAAHSRSGADATICVRNIDLTIPYGVVETEENRVRVIEEKPSQNFLIGAGMYILSEPFARRLKKKESIDMPELINREIGNGAIVHAYNSSDRWIDVGNKETYQKLIELFGR